MFAKEAMYVDIIVCGNDSFVAINMNLGLSFENTFDFAWAIFIKELK